MNFFDNDLNFQNLNQKKCLIVIDYQYDFVADDGTLSLKKVAQSIENNIYNIVNEYLDDNLPVIFTLDEHKKESWDKHPESKNFDIHCESNTKGAKLYGKLEKFMNDERVYLVKKNAFSMPYKFLQQVISSFDEVLLVGVVTDICVLQNAICLYNLATNTQKYIDFFVKENCCASFNQQGHKYSIDYMKNILGFKIL